MTKEEKFNQVFYMYKNDIFHLVYSYTLNKTDSKDIVQETFIKYYVKFDSLPYDNTQIKKWLMKVAINLSKDYFKLFWKKKKVKYEEKYDLAISTNNNKELFEILNSLPKKYRFPIYLYYFEDYNIKEIAILLKTSESAIKMRLSRAKEMLKKEMEMVL